MGVTGVGSFVGLTLIGVPFALPLGIFAFLTEAIPIAGPVIAGIAMIVVAFIQSPARPCYAVGLVVIIQQAESLVLVPVIQGRLISISPVVALLAVLAGSAIGDIPGRSSRSRSCRHRHGRHRRRDPALAPPAARSATNRQPASRP